tara:strand:- start:298 stop:480 length:183 start_codon:yes stop_codon:yes gene_type:complete
MSRRSKSELREEANVRAEERANRTPAQQIAVLDKKLGTGIGAKKERKRLNNLLASSKNNK